MGQRGTWGNPGGPTRAGTPCGGAAQAWAAPGMVWGPPGPPLIPLSSHSALSLPKKHITICSNPSSCCSCSRIFDLLAQPIFAAEIWGICSPVCDSSEYPSRILFTDGDEREVPLPQPSLFSIRRRPWSRSKEELDEQLGLLGFHMQHDPERQEDEAPSDDYAVHYTGASSSSIRTKVLLRHIMEAPLLGPLGIDLHLGQKPKLGGRYTDISLIYISYFVGTLYIHVSLSFFLLLLFLFYFLTFQNTKRPKIFLLFLFVCFFSF